MKRWALTALVLVLLTAPCSLGNPIPIPTLIMPREYITMSIRYLSTGAIEAEVVGVYPFKNLEYKRVRMLFPVPPSALENYVRVYLNDRELKWRVSSARYRTVLGDFPMIEWEIEPIPEEFNITVVYVERHEARSIVRILYPMATGRYLNGTYAKQCVAEVRIKANELPPGSSVKVAFIPYEGMGPTPPFEVEGSPKEISGIVIRRAGRMFGRLEEDVLVTIKLPLAGASEHKWVPYVPKPDSVELKANVTKDGHASVKAMVILPHGGFRIDWGRVEREGNVFRAYAKAEMWTGPAIQVITRKVHTYDLGVLEPGKYRFELYVTGQLVASINFEVSGTSEAKSWSVSPAMLIALAIIATALACAILLFKPL